MPMTLKEVEDLFFHLRTGDSNTFFKHVDDNVKWTVMGTHPLAGTYSSKEDFLNHTFRRLDKILKKGVILKVNNIILQDNIACVEMESLSDAINGKPFNNTYCWVVQFKDQRIIEVRAYVDSALVQKLIDDNE